MKNFKKALFIIAALTAQAWSANCQDDDPSIGIPAGACLFVGSFSTVSFNGSNNFVNSSNYTSLVMSTNVDAKGSIDPSGKPLVLIYYPDPSQGSDALSMMMITSMAWAAKINGQQVSVIYKKDLDNQDKFFLLSMSVY